jgi:hypothetical protein
VKKFITILLILCSIHFWEFNYIPEHFYSLTDSVSLLILGISFLQIMLNKGMQFKNAIILFFIGIVANIISAYANQGQDLRSTFIGFGSFYFILFYFLLHKMQINRKLLENIIIFFAILYSLLYIIQILIYPNIILNSQFLVDRGIVRIEIEGNGFLMLAYLLMLNRYLINHRLINILFTIGFFIVLVLGAYRTLTFSALLISVIMYFKLTRLSVQNIGLLVLLGLLFVGIFQFKFTSEILDVMVNKSEEHLGQGKSYIRLLEFDYFLSKYPENASDYVFGCGLPSGNSSYARKMGFIEQQYGYNWVDVGIFGFYIIIGMIAFWGLLWYTVKASFIKLKPNYIYLNFYFVYLLISSLTTREIYRTGIFGVEAIALYLIDLAIIDNNISDTFSVSQSAKYPK